MDASSPTYSRSRLLQCLVAAGLAVGAACAPAQVVSVPAAVLNHVEGSAAVSPRGEREWTDARGQRPLQRGDRLWTDRSSRAELQSGAHTLRLSSESHVTLEPALEGVTQLALTQGTLAAHVGRMAPGEVLEIGTPQLALRLRQPGDYRIDVDTRAGTTRVTVISGAAVAYGERGENQDLRMGQRVTFRERSLARNPTPAFMAADDFDRWTVARIRGEPTAPLKPAVQVQPAAVRTVAVTALAAAPVVQPVQQVPAKPAAPAVVAQVPAAVPAPVAAVVPAAPAAIPAKPNANANALAIANANANAIALTHKREREAQRQAKAAQQAQEALRAERVRRAAQARRADEQRKLQAHKAQEEHRLHAQRAEQERRLQARRGDEERRLRAQRAADEHKLALRAAEDKRIAQERRTQLARLQDQAGREEQVQRDAKARREEQARRQEQARRDEQQAREEQQARREEDAARREAWERRQKLMADQWKRDHESWLRQQPQQATQPWRPAPQGVPARRVS